jgi:arabinan endo-1,5-alpha-L-arabinosidase
MTSSVRRRRLFIVLGSAAALVLAHCGTRPDATDRERTETEAEPVTVDNGGTTFNIVARHSGECLDLTNGSSSNGALIRQWPCNGLSAQAWRLQTLNNGYFYLVNGSSGKVLDVVARSTADGAAIDQWSNNGGANQQFQFVPTTDGWFHIIAKHSGKAVEISGCSTADGAGAVQWTVNGQTCQEWRLQPAGAVKVINRNSGKTLDVNGGTTATADGANVDLWTYQNAANQNWSWQHTDSGYYEVIAQHSGKVLDVTNCSTANGANVRQWTWLDNTCQQWRITPTTEGYFQLTNRNSGEVLDSANCGVPNGTNVDQWSLLNNDCQKFRFEPTGFDAKASDVPAHDPAIMQEGSYHYLFVTGGTLSIRRSTDLLSWTAVGNVFSAIPSWIATQLGTTITDLWAPDISYFGGRYHLYYAASVFGTNNSLIGEASTPTLDPSSPSYHWTDDGMIFRTTSSNNYNAIDPNISFDANGVPWLAFGSFWDGIKMRQIDAGTAQLSTQDATLYSLASRNGGAIEASSIISANGYYYLFVSYDACCQGADSTYRTMVGRSTSITGPYTDSAGNPMMSGDAEQLLAGIDHWRGPGGGTAHFEGASPYYAHHYYDSLDSGNPKLQIRPISWSSTNWPLLGAPIP